MAVFELQVTIIIQRGSLSEDSMLYSLVPPLLKNSNEMLFMMLLIGLLFLRTGNSNNIVPDGCGNSAGS